MDKDKQEKITDWSQKTLDHINEMAQDGIEPHEAAYILNDIAVSLAIECGGLSGVAMIGGFIQEHANKVLNKREEQAQEILEDADGSGDSTETEGWAQDCALPHQVG